MANRRQKKKWAIVFTLLCCLLLSFYVFRFANSLLELKVELKTSEEHMRTVAWWILAFADEHGTFPSSNDDLLQIKPGYDLSHSLLNDSTLDLRKYPLSTTEARTQGTQLNDLRYSLQIVSVNYSDDPGIALSLSVNQQFEDRDRELVNSWLRHAQEHLKSN